MFSWMDQAKQIFSAEKAAPRCGWRAFPCVFGQDVHDLWIDLWGFSAGFSLDLISKANCCDFS